MVKYSRKVLPGIDLYIHNVQENEALAAHCDLEDIIVIHFCTAGMCERIASSEIGVLLQDGGISISRVNSVTYDGSDYYFPMGKYQGVELLINPDEAEKWCSTYAPAFSISFSEIIGRTLGSRRFRYGKASLECEHIMRELYSVNSHRPQMWIRLKIFELMMALEEGIVEWKQEYIPSDRIQLARHLRDHIIGLEAGEFSLERIAEEHKLSVSQMQRIFKAVYGQSMYQYHKQYRLEEAAGTLQGTNICVEEIAFAAGYQSVSKFTAAFKTQFGITPLSFRHRKAV